MNRLSYGLATAICSVLLVNSANADIVYQIIDYGTTIQEGYTLTGNIVVVDSAVDDGVLDSSEVVSWQFSATNGINTYASSSADSGASFDSGAAITSTSISTTGQINLSTDDRFLRYHDSANQYRLQDGSDGQIWFDNKFNSSPIQIATAAAVPEPGQHLALLALFAVVVTGYGIRRRMKKATA